MNVPANPYTHTTSHIAATTAEPGKAVWLVILWSKA